MGCLKFIISLVVKAIFTLFLVIFAVYLFIFGGFNRIKDYVNSFINPTEQTLTAKASKIADFSGVGEEYELTRTIDMLGVQAVLAQNKLNNQKMAFVDTGWAINLSKNDIRSKSIDKQLVDIAAKFNTPAVKLENLKIVGKGYFKAFGQSVPYVRVKLHITGTPNKSFEGILGVVEEKDKKNSVIISVNDVGKYSQQKTEKFFESVKLN